MNRYPVFDDLLFFFEQQNAPFDQPSIDDWEAKERVKELWETKFEYIKSNIYSYCINFAAFNYSNLKNKKFSDVLELMRWPGFDFSEIIEFLDPDIQDINYFKPSHYPTNFGPTDNPFIEDDFNQWYSEHFVGNYGKYFLFEALKDMYHANYNPPINKISGHIKSLLIFYFYAAKNPFDIPNEIIPFFDFALLKNVVLLNKLSSKIEVKIDRDINRVNESIITNDSRTSRQADYILKAYEIEPNKNPKGLTQRIVEQIVEMCIKEKKIPAPLVGNKGNRENIYMSDLIFPKKHHLDKSDETMLNKIDDKDERNRIRGKLIEDKRNKLFKERIMENLVHYTTFYRFLKSKGFLEKNHS